MAFEVGGGVALYPTPQEATPVAGAATWTGRLEGRPGNYTVRFLARSAAASRQYTVSVGRCVRWASYIYMMNATCS